MKRKRMKKFNVLSNTELIKIKGGNREDVLIDPDEELLGKTNKSGGSSSQ